MLFLGIVLGIVLGALFIVWVERFDKHGKKMLKGKKSLAIKEKGTFHYNFDFVKRLENSLPLAPEGTLWEITSSFAKSDKSEYDDYLNSDRSFYSGMYVDRGYQRQKGDVLICLCLKDIVDSDKTYGGTSTQNISRFSYKDKYDTYSTWTTVEDGYDNPNISNSLVDGVGPDKIDKFVSRAKEMIIAHRKENTPEPEPVYVITTGKK